MADEIETYLQSEPQDPRVTKEHLQNWNALKKNFIPALEEFYRRIGGEISYTDATFEEFDLTGKH